MAKTSSFLDLREINQQGRRQTLDSVIRVQCKPGRLRILAGGQIDLFDVRLEVIKLIKKSRLALLTNDTETSQVLRAPLFDSGDQVIVIKLVDQRIGFLRQQTNQARRLIS